MLVIVKGVKCVCVCGGGGRFNHGTDVAHCDVNSIKSKQMAAKYQ